MSRCNHLCRRGVRDRPWPDLARVRRIVPPLLAALGPAACYEGLSANDPPPPADEPSVAEPSMDDVGHVPLHRLSRAEYEHTLTDLFGRPLPAAEFIRGGTGVGFDNQADLLRDLSDDLVRGYVLHAREVASKVIADPAARARVTPCPPDTLDDDCLRETIVRFGLRAWRRPLDDDERERLAHRIREAHADGASPDEALALLVRMLIGSPHFVLHVELDPEPDGFRPHPLPGFELASRLSYLLWQSMPDDALFELAARGALDDDTVLAAEVDRMLDDERAARFRRAFLESWLHVPLLDAQAHLVDTEIYPAFTAALGHDMRAELEAFLDEFIAADLPWPTFVTADMQFVTPELASHYGIPVPHTAAPNADLVRVDDHPDARIGYLGLAGFLTYTSRADRTAPTLRGKIVLEALQCTVLVIPPDIPALDPPDPGTTEVPTIREQLERHRASPDCAVCHVRLDPIGLALEHFDAIGAWRDTYDDGHAIDARAEFHGQPIDGLLELAQGLAEQPDFLRCPGEKLFVYALRRTPIGDDRKWIDRLATDWNAGSLRDLVQRMVTAQAFRWRRGAGREGGAG